MRVVLLAVAVVVAGTAGCGANWLTTSFLDPTDVNAGYNRTSISEIQRSLSFADTPPDVPGAEEPTPDDLVAVLEEYRLTVGDAVEIRIMDIVQRGIESVYQLTVNEVGDIQIPQLGWIRVDGMTARDVEQAVIDRAVQRGLFIRDKLPPVQIVFLTRQKQRFSVSGAVQNAGSYRILEPDFRLIEALMLAGGYPEQIKTIYVYRSQPRPTRTVTAVSTTESPTPGPLALPPQRGTEAPPVAPVSMSDLGSDGGGWRVENGTTAPATGPATGPTEPSGPTTGPETAPTNADSELIRAIAPQTAPAGPTVAPAPQGEPGFEPPPTKFIYRNGNWVIEKAPTQGTAPTQTPPEPTITEPSVTSTTTTPSTGPVTTEPVTWESVSAEDRQRIIKIPADALRRGDSRYNIVVRHHDVIYVDPGPVGEFYMMGNVLRPGPYSLTGREVTLKQALAAAGGLGPLAWPSRCEITRRLDQDREQIIPVNLEQIFAGRQNDVYLRPNDIVLVGTHMIAPFLATIRSSFRMSYGFGFVYDRNFGDIDSYGGKVNPETVRRQQLQSRFPGLFP